MSAPKKPSPIIAIEAGNSRIKLGLFEPGTPPVGKGLWPVCRQFAAIPVQEAVPWDVVSRWMTSETATAKAPSHESIFCVISGSNPSELERLVDEWPRQFGSVPTVVRDHSAINVEMDVDFPEKVGLDRLLKVVAVNSIREMRRAAIVIDSGTATTVDEISSAGVFCGGAILPGLEMSAKALNHYTAALPLLPVQELGGNPPTSPGRNTREAIRNGLLWGQVGAIKELMHRLCVDRGYVMSGHLGSAVSETDFQTSPKSPSLFLTGGGGPVLAPHFPMALHIPSLGMHGLVLTAWNRAGKHA